MVSTVSQTVYASMLVQYTVLIKQLKRDRIKQIAVAHIGDKRVDLRDCLLGQKPYGKYRNQLE